MDTPTNDAAVKNTRRRWIIGLFVGAVDLFLVAIFTTVLFIFGRALIVAVVHTDNAQTVGTAAWFGLSLLISLFSVVILNIVGAGFIFVGLGVRWLFAPHERMYDNSDYM